MCREQRAAERGSRTNGARVRIVRDQETQREASATTHKHRNTTHCCTSRALTGGNRLANPHTPREFGARCNSWLLVLEGRSRSHVACSSLCGRILKLVQSFATEIFSGNNRQTQVALPLRGNNHGQRALPADNHMNSRAGCLCWSAIFSPGFWQLFSSVTRSIVSATLSPTKSGVAFKAPLFFQHTTSPALILWCPLSFHAPKITPERSHPFCSSSENTGESKNARVIRYVALGGYATGTREGGFREGMPPRPRCS